jgi:hypothetical protein
MNRKRDRWLVLGFALVATMAGFTAMAAPSQPRSFFNCKIVSCPAPQCEENEHLQVPPGQCCPICVPN